MGKKIWKSKFAPAGWQQRVFDVCWKHSWICNCQCMSWNCITIVSQKVEGGQKEFVGVKWYNIPPFTLTVCYFGVLGGLCAFGLCSRCSSFSKACPELYYVVSSGIASFCFCCMLNAGPHWLHFMPPCPERLMLRSIFATWYFGLQNLLSTFTHFQEIFVLAWQMDLHFSKVWIWGWLHELHLSHNDLDAQVASP